MRRSGAQTVLRVGPLPFPLPFLLSAHTLSRIGTLMSQDPRRRQILASAFLQSLLSFLHSAMNPAMMGFRWFARSLMCLDAFATMCKNARLWAAS